MRLSAILATIGTSLALQGCVPAPGWCDGAACVAQPYTQPYPSGYDSSGPVWYEGSPTIIYEGSRIPLYDDPSLGWGWWDSRRSWHSAPPEWRGNLDRGRRPDYREPPRGEPGRNSGGFFPGAQQQQRHQPDRPPQRPGPPAERGPQQSGGGFFPGARQPAARPEPRPAPAPAREQAPRSGFFPGAQ